LANNKLLPGLPKSEILAPWSLTCFSLASTAVSLLGTGQGLWRAQRLHPYLRVPASAPAMEKSHFKVDINKCINDYQTETMSTSAIVSRIHQHLITLKLQEIPFPFLFVCLFETRSCYVTQAAPELVILLS
jgi:hypothetical protein